MVIIVGQCEYESKTYDINHTYITLNCKSSCACVFVNGIAKLSCDNLCTTPKDPGCREKTQQVEIYQELVKGSNCSCPANRCITGWNYLEKIKGSCYLNENEKA